MRKIRRKNLYITKVRKTKQKSWERKNTSTTIINGAKYENILLHHIGNQVILFDLKLLQSIKNKWYTF